MATNDSSCWGCPTIYTVPIPPESIISFISHPFGNLLPGYDECNIIYLPEYFEGFVMFSIFDCPLSLSFSFLFSFLSFQTDISMVKSSVTSKSSGPRRSAKYRFNLLLYSPCFLISLTADSYTPGTILFNISDDGSILPYSSR